jgi:hypothetical protein
MASVGLMQEEMAAVLEMSVETLVKHYKAELATAVAVAKAVGRSLRMQAVGGPRKDWTKAVPAAGIWWSKTRMRWKELPAEHRLSGPRAGPIQSEAVSAHEIIARELDRLAARVPRSLANPETRVAPRARPGLAFHSHRFLSIAERAKGLLVSVISVHAPPPATVVPLATGCACFGESSRRGFFTLWVPPRASNASIERIIIADRPKKRTSSSSPASTKS